MGFAERIVAYTRVRPFNHKELHGNNCKPPCTHPVVDITSERTLTFNPSKLKVVAPVSRFSTARTRVRYDQHYEFEGVFGPESTEEEVYEKVAKPLLETAIQGSNATMFAYGATGCGKSHTVSSINERLAEDLFKRIEELSASTQFTVKVSYLQLYNEKLIDLLPSNAQISVESKPDPTSDNSNNHNMRKIKRNGLYLRDVSNSSAESSNQIDIPGMTEYEVSNTDDMHELFHRGNKNRCVATTQANSQSSRSHALLTVKISSHNKDSDVAKEASLTIIDLAGSERAQSTQNRGQRLAEGASINKSLLALGNCINARAKKSPFVPYRESKLTRLLRFSLEGKCKTAMVVCVSPSISNFDETHYTLEYAKRASSITGSLDTSKNKPKEINKNKDLEAEITEMSQWRYRCVKSLCEAFPGLEITVNSYGGWSTISPERLVQALQKSAIPVSSARLRSSPLRNRATNQVNENYPEVPILRENPSCASFRTSTKPLSSKTFREAIICYSRADTTAIRYPVSPLKRLRRDVS
ncbi:tubulin-dependent ATPase [Starmerella bacillaris]|uniref:Kinesin-like protein n=1 Tax=Starmerella bacillaris TaxID=1247836 RepID=A0AAV5RI58_STABA|nr:tubulin-dependent ATPase [Starmerella bacillaris]